jgi:hypothetical protein
VEDSETNPKSYRFTELCVSDKPVAVNVSSGVDPSMLLPRNSLTVADPDMSNISSTRFQAFATKGLALMLPTVALLSRFRMPSLPPLNRSSAKSYPPLDCPTWKILLLLVDGFPVTSR